MPSPSRFAASAAHRLRDALLVAVITGLSLEVAPQAAAFAVWLRNRPSAERADRFGRLQQTDQQAGRSDGWVIDLARAVKTRLTLDATNRHTLPLWSPGFRRAYG